MAVNSEWGILRKIPVSDDYNQLIYDQTVLGMDYLDCSTQTLSLIDSKLKDHTGEVVNLHENRVVSPPFSLRSPMSDSGRLCSLLCYVL